jgi:hypothetical protein
MRAGITRRAVAAFIFGLFGKRSRASTPPVVSVADYGALPGSDDATAGVRAAISQLPKRGGATLFFPPGAYNFVADPADDAALRLNGVEKLTIDGRGATLNMHGRLYPAVFVNCDGLTVRGLSIDWPRPPFSQGEVVSVSAGGETVDIEIDREFPVDGTEKIEAITTHERDTGQMTKRGVDVYRVVETVALVRRQQLDGSKNLALLAGT